MRCRGRSLPEKKKAQTDSDGQSLIYRELACVAAIRPDIATIPTMPPAATHASKPRATLADPARSPAATYSATVLVTAGPSPRLVNAEDKPTAANPKARTPVGCRPEHPNQDRRGGQHGPAHGERAYGTNGCAGSHERECAFESCL